MYWSYLTTEEGQTVLLDCFRVSAVSKIMYRRRKKLMGKPRTLHQERTDLFADYYASNDFVPYLGEIRHGPDVV